MHYKSIHDNEAELAVFLKEKSRAAFDYLYHNYGGILYMTIGRVTCNSNGLSIEELLQDTFVQVWAKISEYDPAECRLFNWIINIAKATAMNAVNIKNSAAKPVANPHNEVLQETSYNADAAIKKVVARLQPDHQDIIDLVYYQGLKVPDAAEKLQLPHDTIKTRLRDAIQALRQSFYDVPTGVTA